MFKNYTKCSQGSTGTPLGCLLASTCLLESTSGGFGVILDGFLMNFRAFGLFFGDHFLSVAQVLYDIVYSAMSYKMHPSFSPHLLSLIRATMDHQ